MVKLIVANWKANVTAGQAIEWFQKIKEANCEVAIAPPLPLLNLVNNQLSAKKLISFSLSAQDVSVFNNGPYTGETPAGLLSELGVKYVLIGHSERRLNFKETNETIYRKFHQATMSNLIPVICAQTDLEIPQEIIENKKILEDVNHKYIIMYEPSTAISNPNNFHPEDPQKVSDTIAGWKEKLGLNCPFLYGGSINKSNISQYAKLDILDGFVIGQASLNPDSFYEILRQI